MHTLLVYEDECHQDSRVPLARIMAPMEFWWAPVPDHLQECLESSDDESTTGKDDSCKEESSSESDESSDESSTDCLLDMEEIPLIPLKPRLASQIRISPQTNQTGIQPQASEASQIRNQPLTRRRRSMVNYK